MRPFGTISKALFLACGLGCCAAAARAEDFALIVGASRYEKAVGLKDLKYARDDAIAFAELLRAAGYRPGNLVLIHDGLDDPALWPRGPNILLQLDRLLERVGPGDTIVIALAGHGVQFRGLKTSYFCPIDANLERPETLIALTEIYAKLDACKAAHKLLLADACRNDPQAAGARGSGKLPLEPVARPQIEPIPPSITALFSCQPGAESFEDDALGHGVFFAQVLAAWQGAADGADHPVAHSPDAAKSTTDGRVTLAELIRYVVRQTAAHAARSLQKEQLPWARNEAVEWLLPTPPPHAPTTPRAVLAPLAEARRLLQARRYEEARTAYARLIEAHPDLAAAYHGRGLTALAQGKPHDALDDLRRAVQLDAKDVQAWISLGGAQGRTGAAQEAVQSYGEALKRDPRAVNAYVGRGAARAELRLLDAALEDLNQALQLQPDHPEALYYRAVVHDRRGDPAAAAADRKRLEALENRP